jgi:acyl carrier protein
MSNDIKDRVLAIIMKYSKSDLTAADVKPETSLLGDLQVNSARLVDIIIDFEEEFDIEIEDSEADSVATVQDAVDMVSKKSAA